jgi:ribosome biogenesis GTPase A
MFESIVSGVARKSRASSPRMSDDDKMRRAIAIELLENVAKAKGKALPKRSKPEEKEAFETFLANALQNAKFAAAVEKEFSDRKRKAAKQSDDFADIF